MSAGSARVVIAGAGVAGLEALLALRHGAPPRTEIVLVSPEPSFLYRPVTVAEAFDRGQARSYPLAELVQEAGGRLLADAVTSVDAAARQVGLRSGGELNYDALLIAIGAVDREPLPGALTFRGRADVAALRELRDELATRRAASVAVTLPSPRMWTLPAYELALLLAADLRRRGVGAPVWLVTPEEEPLALFGPEAALAVTPLLEARGVRLRTGARPARLRGRTLVLAGGGEVAADRVITLPRLEGPRLRGLPGDEDGFIPTDHHGQVPGRDGVYAAGDATTFPLRQGGLAAQQADAAAAAIGHRLGGAARPAAFRPVLRGLLITGGAPLYLRAEPQRLARASTVAIEAVARNRAPRTGAASFGEPLWWPPAKIAGRYLGPFLARVEPDRLDRTVLADREPAADAAEAEHDFDDALELALLLADCDARWGDYAAALTALAAAETLAGTLPAPYERKRHEWLLAERRAG